MPLRPGPRRSLRPARRPCRSAAPPLTTSLLAAALIMAAATPAGGQETGDAAQGRQCTLRWRPLTDSTESRSVQTTEGAFTHYVWNGMRWTCGGSTITADSAVQREAAGRVEMYGNVHYRDSVRVLDSRRLTYHRGRELVVAREDVHLTLLASGSTLEGPYVEFYRPGSGREERTVATRRPHMTVYPPGDTADGDPGAPQEEPDPYQVDADTVIIHGERETEALGDVVVTRTEIQATGRRAVFDNRRGRGKLWGEPRASSEEFRLTGDTIRLATEEGEVRTIHGIGHGRLTGEDVDVRGEKVTARLDGRRVEMLWSHGGSNPRAVSAGRELTGDSLRFAFRDGRLDSAVAVGRAAAVDVDSVPGMRRGGEQGAPGDTARAPSPDTADAPPADTADSSPPDTVDAPPADTADGTPGDTVNGSPPDTTDGAAEPGPVAPGPAGADTAPAASPPDTTGPDSTVAPSESLARSAGGDGPRPAPARESLGLHMNRDWIVGDTVIAVFEPADPAEATAPGEPTDTTAAGDTAGDRRRNVRMRELTARGNARSFYLVARDTADGAMARNYMIGRQITVTFRQGEPHRVRGTQAIGVYLEPDGDGPPGPETTPEGRNRRRPPPPDTASRSRSGGG